MSWSFSVKEKNKEDALRQFANGVFDNSSHFSSEIGENLTVAATALAANPPKDSEVLISTSGHVDPNTGFGYGVVRFEFVKAEFVPPHLEK